MAQVSAGALRHNIALLRQQLAPGVKLCAVVKANAYGHGLDLLLPTIAPAADYLAVAAAAEALELRWLGYTGKLMMIFTPSLCPEDEQADMLDELTLAQVTLTVVTGEEARAVNTAAARTRTCAAIHVKIDTGMRRSGVELDQAAPLVQAIAALPHVRLEGLYTHFATADEADKSFVQTQFDRFSHVAAQCDPEHRLIRHAANSAALLDQKATHADMVRPGLALYGCFSGADIRNRPSLRPALRLTTRLMQTRPVKAGDSCGYGLTYTFARDGRAGLVPVGYADGYSRAFSNRGVMRVRGKLVPVRGRVAMDQLTVDLTDCPEARAGDEVEIISPDPTAPNAVENLARLAGTIPYEPLTLLGRRVRRVLVD
ncbi:MAG: alanine racemase [Planctomycetota bacterium]|nr:alanine racemase [Planctomycetota bacterium]